MHRSVLGFLSKLRFAKESADEMLFFIPYIDGNQSTIENVFSQLRARHRDTASTCAKGITAINLNVSLKRTFENNNGMYLSEHIGDEEIGSTDSLNDKGGKKGIAMFGYKMLLGNPP